MDFAEKELMKYGWVKATLYLWDLGKVLESLATQITLGNGLGKREKGLSEPIKVRQKRDSAGLGFDAASEFTSHWWDKVFNQAANNISVLEDVEGSAVAVKTKTDSSSERKKRHYGNSQKALYYGGFLATSNSHSGLPNSSENEGKEEAEVGERCVGDGGGGNMEVHGDEDEKLFEACGGRTAHKAARHGCKLSGKLQRLQDQERAVQLSMEQIGLAGRKEEKKGQRKKKQRHSEHCPNKKKQRHSEHCPNKKRKTH